MRKLLEFCQNVGQGELFSVTGRRIGFLLFLVSLAGCRGSLERPDPLPGFPNLILWAWERPENLSFIVPKVTGVAFLSATITLNGGSLSYQPRRQPLHVPPATRLIAVIRMESHGDNQVDARQVAEAIVRASLWQQVGAVQVDFDARFSERAFYREVLTEVRHRLPMAIPLEITALVSWCTGDDWLRGLPVADAVPMFFRMGADSHGVSERLQESLCTSSIGISTDEFYTGIPRGRRVFVFHNRSWTEADYRALLVERNKW
jgi:hypothetical protein